MVNAIVSFISWMAIAYLLLVGAIYLVLSFAPNFFDSMLERLGLKHAWDTSMGYANSKYLQGVVKDLNTKNKP